MILSLTGPTALELSGFGHGGFHVHGDAEGEGFGPLQMFAASLALCSAAVLDAYARGVLRISTEELVLRVEWEYAEKPHRIGRIRMDVIWPGLPENRVESTARALRSCTIHRTLEHPPPIETSVHVGDRLTPRPSPEPTTDG